MNQKLPYELTIAEKLELLTVPDMVDAIWARIETQLDIDMPTDDGPPEPPATPTTGTGNWINTGFLIALIIILFTQVNKQQKNKEISIGKPVIDTQNIPDNKSNPPLNNSPGEITEAVSPSGRNKVKSEVIAPADSISGNFDEVGMTEVLPTDSSLSKQPEEDNVIISPALSDQKTDSTNKKSRGVKGITDENYRIVPKKDSGG